MVRSTDITSFTEHRQHLREHIDQVNKTGRPLYVTTNGKTEAVVLSPEAYDRLAEQAQAAEHLDSLRRSLEQSRSGRGIPLEDAVRQVAERLQLKVRR